MVKLTSILKAIALKWPQRCMAIERFGLENARHE
jgi:hypothetical protein